MMKIILRLALLVFSLIVWFVSAFVVIIVRPFYRNNVFFIGHFLSKLSPLVNIELETRGENNLLIGQPCVYIANHQNNFDLFTHTAMITSGTVSIGKKSLKWIPIFGQVYLLSGNILIDRINKNKAMKSLNNALDKIKHHRLSIWLFPEGTRSKGKGLLPFKMGAFHLALDANVPIVPVVASSQLHIDLFGKRKTKVIVEALPPIFPESLNKENLRHSVEIIHDNMLKVFHRLSKETEVVNQKKLPNHNDRHII